MNKCPTCGFDKLEFKHINHVVAGGNNTAIIDAEVEVCTKCGETLFTAEQVQLFEEIKSKLEKEETHTFVPIGKNYRVA